MMYPLVDELAATNAPIRVPVTVTCRVLGFTAAFYKWRANPVSARDLADAYCQVPGLMEAFNPRRKDWDAGSEEVPR